MQCHKELRIQKKKKKYCKRVVVPPFDFLEVYYEILIAGNKGKRLEKKKKRKKERKNIETIIENHAKRDAIKLVQLFASIYYIRLIMIDENGNKP